MNLTRAQLIEHIAGVFFGRDPSNGTAASGWQSKLSTALGMSRSAVNDTLALANSEKFDRRLGDFVAGRRLQMIRDAIELDFAERELRGQGASVASLWTVVQTTPTQHTVMSVWGANPGAIAAFYIRDILPDDMIDKLKIRYDDDRGIASAGEFRVEVRRARSPIELSYDDLAEVREMLKSHGHPIAPQYVKEEK
jgi:hypothetical protein